MTITLNGDTGITSPNDTTGNQSYTGTLTGGTGVVNLGSGQFYKDASGNVGIGTSSPGVKLDVVGSSAIIGRFVSSGATGVVVSDGSTRGGAFHAYQNGTLKAVFGVSGTWLGDTSSDAAVAADTGSNIRFYTNGSGTERMRIDTSGNLLVNTVNTAANAGDGLKFLGGTSNRLQIVNSGAAEGIMYYNSSAGAYRFYVNSSGTIFATSTTISAISDQRLKENVRDLNTGLDAIMAVKPRRFDWKEGKGLDKKDDVGFIAQEFETVFPDSVTTSLAGKDGIEYKTINHGELIPTLVKAIQEQQALIESLTTRLTVLEAK